MILLLSTLEPIRINLLPQFVAHYRALGVERFVLSLHVDPALGEEAGDLARARFEAMLDRLGIPERYYFVGPFDAAPFYQHLSDLQARHATAEDWIVWADADEFQVYPERLPGVIAKIEPHHVNYVGGVFIDRVAADGSLPEFDPERSIWEQFPVTCLVTQAVAHGDTKKVVLARGWVQLAHGSHVPAIMRPEHSAPLRIPKEEHPKLLTIDGRVQVHHFKWDAQVLHRLRQRVTPEWKAKHSYWIESQRLLDYFVSHDLKFDFRDLTLIHPKAGQLMGLNRRRGA